LAESFLSFGNKMIAGEQQVCYTELIVVAVGRVDLLVFFFFFF